MNNLTSGKQRKVSATHINTNLFQAYYIIHVITVLSGYTPFCGILGASLSLNINQSSCFIRPQTSSPTSQSLYCSPFPFTVGRNAVILLLLLLFFLMTATLKDLTLKAAHHWVVNLILRIVSHLLALSSSFSSSFLLILFSSPSSFSSSLCV